MHLVNTALRSLFDVLLAPMRGWPPIIGLIIISALAAIGMLLVFKVTSNQPGIDRAKRRIHACLFEIRLFNDDLRTIMAAQLELLRHNLTYLRHSLVPMLWMIVPFVLLIAQLQFHYGYTGLQPGHETMVKVRLDEQWTGTRSGRPNVRLEAPEGIRVISPDVWLPAAREIDWRIEADSPGSYELGVVLDGQEFSKRLQVSDRVVRRSPVRVEAGFLRELIYPAEPPLPADGPIDEIWIGYPMATVSVLGIRLHWLVVFFVLSIAIAFGLRKRFGVVI